MTKKQKEQLKKLKKEWDKSGGKLIRKCRICLNEFTLKHWRQTICEEKFCKEGSFRESHFRASKDRWEKWLKRAKEKNISFMSKYDKK